MALLMTHSLLSSWLYCMKDDPFSDATTERDPMAEFMQVLRREPTPTSEAMQNGIDFEDRVTGILRKAAELPGKPEWQACAEQIARKIEGAQLQYPACKTVRIAGLDVLLHGRLDALKAGHIYDIKFSKTYDRGKYIDSTQHPMYLELVPTAEDFTYLVTDGREVWTETYRRDETRSVIPVVRDFLRWLDAAGLRSIYDEHWQARS